MSDQRLLQQFMEKNPKAVEAIFRRWHSLLKGVAVTETGDKTAADDIVTDAFLKVVNVLPASVNTLDDVKHYLLTALRHTARDYLRKKASAHKRSEEVAVVIAIHTDEAVMDDAEGDEYIDYYHKQVRMYVETFPKKLRRVMYCRLYEKRSPEETADLLNISRQTVKNQSSKGMQLIKKRFPGFPRLPS